MANVYGTEIARSEYKPLRDLVSLDEATTAAGNVVLRIGREHDARGAWEQVGHVVLTPGEASALASALIGLLA